MALTAAQRRALSRRTTASSRARLKQRYLGRPVQQTLRPTAPAAPQPFRPVGPQAGSRALVPPAASAPGAPYTRPTAQFVPDAQYLAQAAQGQFQRQTQLDQIKAEHDAAVNAHAEGQRRLMEGVPGQRQEVSEGANRQGLFYSRQLGKRLGDLETNIARQRADAQSQFDAEGKAREAARAAILAGEPIETAALRAEAVERQLARDSEAAAQNRLAPTPVPAKKPLARPKARPKPKPRQRPKPRPRHPRRKKR